MVVCFHLDPKEEKEEEPNSALSQEVPAAATRPARGWRSSSRTSVSRHRDAENTRSSRSKTGSLQLICKSEPNTDQLDYGTVQVEYACSVANCCFYLKCNVESGHLTQLLQHCMVPASQRCSWVQVLALLPVHTPRHKQVMV